MTKQAFIRNYMERAYIDNYGNLDGYELWLTSPLSRQEVNIQSCLADDAAGDAGL